MGKKTAGDQEKVTEDEPVLESGVPSSDELAGTEGDQAATNVGEDKDPADADDSSEERIEDGQAGPADNPASPESESDDTADEPVAQDGIAALEESDGALAADPETVSAAQRSNEPDAGEKGALPSEEQESGSGLARFVKKHAVVLTALLVMLVGCVVALGIWIYRNNEAAAHKQEQEQAYQKALGTAQVVPLVIQIDGYDEGTSSPIPLKVTGTSKAGDAVDKVVLVKPSMPQLELLPGTYSIALAGYPVTADGTLFRGSVDTYEVTVGDSSSSDQVKSSGSAQDVVSVTPVFAFAQIAPQEVRDPTSSLSSRKRTAMFPSLGLSRADKAQVAVKTDAWSSRCVAETMSSLIPIMLAGSAGTHIKSNATISDVWHPAALATLFMNMSLSSHLPRTGLISI